MFKFVEETIAKKLIHSWFIISREDWSERKRQRNRYLQRSDPNRSLIKTLNVKWTLCYSIEVTLLIDIVLMLERLLEIENIIYFWTYQEVWFALIRSCVVLISKYLSCDNVSQIKRSTKIGECFDINPYCFIILLKEIKFRIILTDLFASKTRFYNVNYELRINEYYQRHQTGLRYPLLIFISISRYCL